MLLSLWHVWRLNYIKHLYRKYEVGITCYPTSNISKTIQYNTISAFSTKWLGFWEFLGGVLCKIWHGW